MSVAHHFRDGMTVHINILFHNTIVRYLFAIATVASTFALRIWLVPLTGTGAPFVLFFAAVLVTSLFAGVGPGICALLISLPLAAYTFVMRAGYPPFQAASQALLFTIDGIVVVYLTLLMRKGGQAQDANRQLRGANEEVTRSMARTREVIKLAPEPFFLADLDGRYTDVNQAACRLLGYDRDELIGRTIFDIIPVEDAARLERVRAELLVPGRVNIGEWTLRRKNGTFVSVEVSSNILPDGRWQAFVRDISERKRIEEELKAANAFLDAIIENIPLMLFLKESQSLRLIRFNRTGEDLLGWPKQTLIGKNNNFWPKEQADYFVEKYSETLKKRSVVDIPEEPILTRYRGVRILHTKKVPILDSEGNPIYVLGISEDITERKRIEKEQQFLADVSVALSASLEIEKTLGTLAQLVVQNIADWSAVDVMDEEGQLRRLKVASADPSQAALCAVLEQMPPDRDLPHLMRSVIESKRPVLVEHVTFPYIESLSQGPGHLQALLATGTTSLVAVPLLLRGQPLGALVFTSSTPSHAYGQSDLRLAEALADRSAVAIDNARLYRASVHATQLRDQVLAFVAHDLRNPLSNILMQISALKRQGSERELRSLKPLEVIHRAATRMNHLIQDLLDVALMEAGQLTIEQTRQSAGGLIVEEVDMQRPLASSSSLELRIEVEPDVPEVWADRDRLLQVLENLIGNAIKFTKAGGRITVGAASRDDEVVFWVADTGSGIASENLGRVFDRFWQASRAGRLGAGLGLPISKGIVEAHGGRIWVESTAGSGSTFFFTIPIASAAQDKLSDRPRPDRVA
jgi:PAS domain S-box-containing protein